MESLRLTHHEDLARLPGFPPQLGGVEVVVGYLADELCGDGHQVTVYAQRPRGSSFPASPDYPVRRFADWSGSRQFPVAPGLARALWRDRGCLTSSTRTASMRYLR